MIKETEYTDEVHQGRAAMMADIYEIRKFDEPYEQEAYREPLCVMTETVKNIQLSWGGPSDGFKLTFDEQKELKGGVYYRQDWGTYKESDLSDEEAAAVYDFYLGGTCE